MVFDIPNRLNEIIDELKSIQIKTLDYEKQVTGPTLWWTPDYSLISFIDGDEFRRLFDSKFDNKGQFDFATLIKKGDEVAEKRSAVRANIRQLKSLISGYINVKVDENIINIESLEEFENTLETARNKFESLESDYNELVELADEIIPDWIKIQSLRGRNIVYIR